MSRRTRRESPLGIPGPWCSLCDGRGHNCNRCGGTGLDSFGEVRYGSDGNGIFVAIWTSDGIWRVFNDAPALQRMSAALCVYGVAGTDVKRALRYLVGEVHANGEEVRK